MIAISFLKHIQFSLYVLDSLRMGYLRFVLAVVVTYAGGMYR